MKNTGVVRRIDELGRIVIPKEIRRTLRMHEGTQMEIYTTEQGELVLKKFSIIADLHSYSDNFAVAINENLEKSVLICNMDTVVSSAGFSKKEFLVKQISKELESKILERKNYILNKSEESSNIPLIASDALVYTSQIIIPIVVNSDLVGAIVLASTEQNSVFSTNEVKIVQTAAKILAGILE